MSAYDDAVRELAGLVKSTVGAGAQKAHPTDRYAQQQAAPVVDAIIAAVSEFADDDDDDDDLAIRAIATTHIGAWRGDGSPIVSMALAVCNVCGTWATAVLTSGKNTLAKEDFSETCWQQRISRQVTVIAYACADHRQEMIDSLVEEFGHASHGYDPPNDLAAAVDNAARLR